MLKKMKHFLLLLTCAFVLLGSTGCSSRDQAYNGADQSGQSGDSSTMDGTNKNDPNMNDATEGNGVLDDAVDDVTDGVDNVTDDITDGVDNLTDDVTDGVDKAADDLTEDNGVQKDTDNTNR